MRWMARLIVVLSLAVSPVTARADVIDQVWAGHPVAFAMAASDRHLFVGYYDADRRLTVAERDIAGGAWRYTHLDTAVGWDSHNYIAMAIDPVGRLHVAANMHVSPLTYYAAAKPDDAESLRRLPVLVDPAREVRMTYPVFLKDRAGRLIFKYRDGGSGNGNDIYTVYDGWAWAPLLNVPLTDGEGKRNAYPVGPVIGPDGQFHLTWVWRETPDAGTNHDLSYARSADLVHWQKADGTPIVLPMTYGSAEIVDPVPMGGGMINNNTLIGFDADARPLIAYHKYDAAGHTQIYVARFEEDHWHLVQASDWTGYRWEFGGNGSLVFEVTLKAPYARGDEVIIPVTRQGVATELHLRATDLSRVAETPAPPSRFATEIKGMDIPADMQLNQVELTAGGHHYLLAWATLPQNRDQARDVVPSPMPLMLFEK